MSAHNPYLIQRIAKWLEKNAVNIHETLNPGTEEIPSSWPEELREYYRFYNGQKSGSEFLFPRAGNWLSLKDVAAAHKIWLDRNEEYDYEFDWYKESYIPIVGYLEQMEDATVIDIETGRIGDIDLERQEFTFLFNSVDELFADLLKELETSGYPPEIEYRTPTKEELDQDDYEEALKAEMDHRKANNNPSPEWLYAWAMDLFRHMGVKSRNGPNPHAMRLAKKYLDQVPLSHLSKKQLRDLAFFKSSYQKIVKDA